MEITCISGLQRLVRREQAGYKRETANGSDGRRGSSSRLITNGSTVNRSVARCCTAPLTTPLGPWQVSSGHLVLSGARHETEENQKVIKKLSSPQVASPPRAYDIPCPCFARRGRVGIGKRGLPSSLFGGRRQLRWVSHDDLFFKGSSEALARQYFRCGKQIPSQPCWPKQHGGQGSAASHSKPAGLGLFSSLSDTFSSARLALP